jgi:hypothetical protein
MIFTFEEAVEKIKQHQTIKKDWQTMRDYSKELKALVLGKDFHNELINKIDFIESDKKALARQKYARDIKDFFARLFQPIDNIYYATGGVKDFSEINNNDFLKNISNVRDNKTLSKWVQENATLLSHVDPNGLIFLEYKTDPLKVYPTYKSIDSIRYYEAKGQKIEYVIFEPKIKEGKNYFRFVDDLNDFTIKQEGQTYTLVDDQSFTHEFGEVPALIVSDICIAGENQRFSPIENILGISKEYARDLSILSLYKVFKGMPIFWKVVQYCGDCKGAGKIGDEKCGTCDGMGKYVSKTDVTDVVEVPMPDEESKFLEGKNIGGYISPELDTWTKLEETLKFQEELAYKSHWGTIYGMQNTAGNKTATEVIYDKQPLENRLNKYADNVEYIEWQLSEWILNLYDLSKNKDESKITINLGRRYVIESYDALLERYEKSVLAGSNSVVLDKQFLEYINAKFVNNPIDLEINLKKMRVEPYLHLSILNINAIFGAEEAQRKVLFHKWWNELADYKKDEISLISEFNIWFETNKININTNTITQ